jgi:hypothetical protein
MSHTIRRMQRDDGTVITIVPDEVESYWKRGRLPTPMEQADELILWIGDNQLDYTTGVEKHPLYIDAWLGSALSSRGKADGLDWLVSEIDRSNSTPLFNHIIDSGRAWFLLTMAGWEKYAALKQSKADSRIAFMAMKFGDSELEKVVDGSFRPAVAPRRSVMHDNSNHFICFMCLRLLGPKYAPDVGRRRHRAASYFSFADECDIFTIRLDGKN